MEFNHIVPPDLDEGEKNEDKSAHDPPIWSEVKTTPSLLWISKYTQLLILTIGKENLFYIQWIYIFFYIVINID